MQRVGAGVRRRYRSAQRGQAGEAAGGGKVWYPVGKLAGDGRGIHRVLWTGRGLEALLLDRGGAIGGCRR